MMYYHKLPYNAESAINSQGQERPIMEDRNGRPWVIGPDKEIRFSTVDGLAPIWDEDEYDDYLMSLQDDDDDDIYSPLQLVGPPPTQEQDHPQYRDCGCNRDDRHSCQYEY